jgi:hypothetical protein
MSPEALKAWSQNLGHADVLTTFTSYGAVPAHRQGELVRASHKRASDQILGDPDIQALIAKIRSKAA